MQIPNLSCLSSYESNEIIKIIITKINVLVEYLTEIRQNEPLVYKRNKVIMKFKLKCFNMNNWKIWLYLTKILSTIVVRFKKKILLT